MMEDMEWTFLHVYFYPSPVSPKGGEAVCLLGEKLIGKELQDFDKVLQDIGNTFRGLSRGGQTGPPHFRGS